VVGSASIVLAIEEASRRANSEGIREQMPEKSRIIPGLGAIAPNVIRVVTPDDGLLGPYLAWRLAS